jgi:hypothetical protein
MTDPTFAAVAAAINPYAAQRAVAAALAVAGSAEQWDSQTIEFVVAELRTALPADLPSPCDQYSSALRFWQAVDDSR